MRNYITILKEFSWITFIPVALFISYILLLFMSTASVNSVLTDSTLLPLSFNASFCSPSMITHLWRKKIWIRLVCLCDGFKLNFDHNSSTFFSMICSRGERERRCQCMLFRLCNDNTYKRTEIGWYRSKKYQAYYVAACSSCYFVCRKKSINRKEQNVW